jgi:hypothetical protein
MCKPKKVRKIIIARVLLKDFTTVKGQFRFQESFWDFLYQPFPECHFWPPNLHFFTQMCHFFCPRCKSDFEISFTNHLPSVICDHQRANLHFLTQMCHFYCHRCKSDFLYQQPFPECHFDHQICTFLRKYVIVSVSQFPPPLRSNKKIKLSKKS